MIRYLPCKSLYILCTFCVHLRAVFFFLFWFFSFLVAAVVVLFSIVLLINSVLLVEVLGTGADRIGFMGSDHCPLRLELRAVATVTSETVVTEECTKESTSSQDACKIPSNSLPTILSNSLPTAVHMVP